MPATKSKQTISKAPTILIVEDEKELREFVTEYLTQAGYAVLTAADGMLGLRMARESKPDLLILDVMLPKINGFTVCRLLKFDENNKGLPIIMWTWKEADQDRKMGLYAGADVYLPKPFSIGKLLESVVSLIGASPVLMKTLPTSEGSDQAK